MCRLSYSFIEFLRCFRLPYLRMLPFSNRQQYWLVSTEFSVPYLYKIKAVAIALYVSLFRGLLPLMLTIDSRRHDLLRNNLIRSTFLSSEWRLT
jgi:hypothetical protein